MTDLAELNAARARIVELEADLLKIEGFRADLAEQFFAQEGELAALRAVARAAEAVRVGLNEEIRAYNLAEAERLDLVTALDALHALAALPPAATFRKPCYQLNRGFLSPLP